jgi:hypothetical protein
METESVTPKFTLVVTYNDGKGEVIYKTTPADNWRAEELTRQSMVELLQSSRGFSSLAWAAAVRAGDAYKQRKVGSDPRESFLDWISKVDDVAVVTSEDEVPTEAPFAEASTPQSIELPDS